MQKLIEFLTRPFRPSPNHKTLRANGRQMPYLEITTTQQPNQPLLIGIHGYGADEMQMKTLVNLAIDIPHTYIAPRALEKHPTGGYRWFPIEVTNDGIGLMSRQLQMH